MGSQYINQYQGTMSGGWEKMEKMVRINIWSARGGGGSTSLGRFSGFVMASRSL